MANLIYSWGINDSNYKVRNIVNGIDVTCKYYRAWKSMIGRCLSERQLQIRSSYRETLICDDWKYFSNFRQWLVDYELQFSVDTANLHLDKDLLSKTKEKIYSPETCCLIGRDLNIALVCNNKSNSGLPIGSSWHVRAEKFVGQCSLGTGNKKAYGYFDTAIEAHRFWQQQKVQYLESFLAFEYEDKRIIKSLQNIVDNVKQDIVEGRETTHL